ncbi:MAG TPA: phosphomethylpyrimidine synthase ThiC, partial [Longimicrobiales bacterium]|nr:phosphomethylpyrimidine synthase ThiC [Longimicrobiales bacterium]
MKANGSSAPATLEHAFPASRKVHVEVSGGIRVPMREIALSGGEPPLRVYDTSGPQGIDATAGLPKLRRDWINGRGDVELLRSASATAVHTGGVTRNGATPADALANDVYRAKPGARVSQMHYARRGEVTPEMEFIALREGFDVELVRAEVARGRAIIPA